MLAVMLVDVEHSGLVGLEEARLWSQTVGGIASFRLIHRWNGFGGKPERGESMLACARRELEVKPLHVSH